MGVVHNTQSKTQADLFVCLLCVEKLTLNKRPRIKSSCFFSVLLVLQHKHGNETKKGEKIVLTLQVWRRAMKPNSVQKKQSCLCSNVSDLPSVWQKRTDALE